MCHGCGIEVVCRMIRNIYSKFYFKRNNEITGQSGVGVKHMISKPGVSFYLFWFFPVSLEIGLFIGQEWSNESSSRRYSDVAATFQWKLL